MTIIISLAIVVSLAAILGILARSLGQPVILAYIVTGALIGLWGLFDIGNTETFHIFSDLGIMFLLFLVGLEVNYSSLRLVGRTSLIVGLGQIIITFILGYLLSISLGFTILVSTYIALALVFSSTIIIVKLLSEKRAINSLYGKISIGYMLVQDAFIILVLIVLAGVGNNGGEFVLSDVALTLFKGIAIFVLMIWLGRKIVPVIFDRIAQSQELLFVGSVAWVFAFAALAYKLGFSIEIGGFLAGIAMANSSESFHIANRIKSLRDFFILLFFVILGTSLASFDFSGLTFEIIIFSLFVVVGQPIIVLFLLGRLGYRKRTSFLAGVTAAQISEFSLILIAIGFRLGHLPEAIVGLITAVAVITITVSAYLIAYADTIAKQFPVVLGWFERDKIIEDDLKGEDLAKPIILIGAHRTGQSIAYHIPKEKLLIVDFDPDVIGLFKKEGFTCLLGDIADDEVLDKIDIEKAHLIISTSPDYNDNMTLINNLKDLPGKRKTIIRAETEDEARLLYEAGVDYVVFPHLTSGHYLGKNIKDDPSVSFLSAMREKDLLVMEREMPLD